MATSKTTTVSSPGKVLLAGGYLVLDREYSGLVVATSSRFYSTVTSLPKSTDQDKVILSVRAGQFPKESSTWTYAVSIQNDRLMIDQINENAVGKNKFISIALFQTLSLAWEKIATESSSQGLDSGHELLRRITNDGKSDGLEIVVLADNDFYSQREQLSAMSLPTQIRSLSSLQPFTPLPRPIPQTNKTGLGSSAALVTSLVASLLSHLNIVTLPSSSPQSNSNHDLQLVHSLAQFAHCLAQGKVGSGFDVSSAVFGTHIYTRFSPSVLSPLMDRPLDSITFSSPTLLPVLESSQWDQRTTAFRLPKGLRLILADVDAGTDTPSFVGKVLTWRKENPEVAKKLWDDLDRANRQIERLLTELVAREGEHDYEETVGWMGERHIEDVTLSCANIHCSQSAPRTVTRSNFANQIPFQIIRDFQRKMSELSGVPIEPPEQTRLLDACSELEGVIGGGVPGAGGYDALFLLIVDTPSVVSRVDNLWSGWKEMSVCPLLAKQSDDGLRLEELIAVKGLKEALGR
ncbi:phosphomevalonate kinase [Kwoniella mangroviensis CBS 10435]|uniref:Phosphomevalonate kinase n=1 Tax=Kwoniella mangroviensis CBS 10435 TaxID=1331196 RepID=A0A1B9IGS9_9TREE|nr:phosphomevalonate kinase [Kwoniella mangroviensis CBS 10435]OCF78759.1 phosphomevalonate kinase [Kwoniella mangroviensis CBS 8886]